MGIKGKYFMIVNRATGLVLDIKGGSDSPGSDVIMWEKSGNDNQVWYEHPLTGTVRSKKNHLCLDLNSSDRLIVNEYKHGEKNQEWRYNKHKKTIENVHSDKVLDVVGNSTDSGTEICAWDYHGAENQLWKIEALSTSMYFFIKSEMNGKVLDIEGGSKDAGAKVIMYDQKDAGDADNQLWFEDRFGNIRSKLNPHLVLDANGDCVCTSEFDLGNHKQFWCVCDKKIVNRHNPNEVLDIKGGSGDSGAELCGWNYKGSDNQHWRIEHV